MTDYSSNQTEYCRTEKTEFVDECLSFRKRYLKNMAKRYIPTSYFTKKKKQNKDKRVKTLLSKTKTKTKRCLWVDKGYLDRDEELNAIADLTFIELCGGVCDVWL